MEASVPLANEKDMTPIIIIIEQKSLSNELVAGIPP